MIGGVCPLILDDDTVHLDRERRGHLLETFMDLSRDRQTILFL